MLFTGDRARDLPETLTGFLSGPLDSIVMFSICYILKLLLKDQFTLHNCCVTPSHATCLQLELYCVNKHTTHVRQRIGVLCTWFTKHAIVLRQIKLLNDTVKWNKGKKCFRIQYMIYLQNKAEVELCRFNTIRR
jgi:hypothetical protein